MKFENMEIWKRSARLSAELYKALADCKDFGFKDQITRSGLSVPSNIAEGSERSSVKDFIRFLQYAKGSCGELRTQIYIGIDIGYIEQTQGNAWVNETREISAMLVGFINSLEKN
ncbi:four helix bundle protein [Oligosphaera ethanolica]|jgi:four helix bundle protein|uniref:Four helix bundle protein n=1 Tax=Oligosphaera ethanolica TaxID=760260 RepID=A0AAE4AQG3_9BACT|nr:four helix bundle protein [Oligosphaera ethanolica]MDQ0291490.1 four helix bundle protein [Oligosphaera ethanolica]NLE54061.1 four helix bundle protein [Lentisphaerota bacterium]